MHEYLDLLRRRPHYRRLWIGRLVSNLGDWFNLLASAQLIASLTNSGSAISFLFLARFLPVFLATPFAGVLADRVNRRAILVATDLLRAVTVLCFLLVRDAGQIWLFYALTALQFTLSALYNPAHSAVLANVVKPDELVIANTLDGFTWSTMLALGALLGGVAAALFGVQVAFLIDAGSFLLSAAFVSRVQLVYAAPRSVAEGEIAQGGFLDFVDGLRYLKARRLLLGLALAKAGGSIIWGAINVLEIPLSNDIFPLNGSGTLTLGIIYALVGIGTGAGPVFLRAWLGDAPHALLRAIGIGFILLTIGALGIGLAPALWVVLVSITLRAVGSGAIWVFSASLLIGAVEDRFRGRVLAFEFTTLTLAESIGTIYGGVALDRLGWGVQQSLLVVAAASVAVTAIWYLFGVRAQAAVARGALRATVRTTA
jgi:MFS family permease